MTRDANLEKELKLVQVGNYKFTGKTLGKGSFAIVKEAVHIYLKTKVSVKIINLHKCNSYVLKNLMREATILQTVDHPHIVRLFETIENDRVYYIMTEIVRGGDLCSYVQHLNGRMKESTARRFSRQIASALRYLHAEGIVHRDLKLENVMLDSARENIKLIDFGLSNRWSPDAPLKTLCGSPEYSAPELFVHGHRYGPEVDMWALGVIMFAMAAGRLPFPCLSAVMKVPEKKAQFLKIINHGLVEAQTRLISNYAPEFLQLVKKLMNPDAKERISIQDVFEDAWITNNEHWAETVYNTLDAYDLESVCRQVSAMLGVSAERLKTEVKMKPFGESGGFYNITVYDRIHSRANRRSLSESLTSETSTTGLLRLRKPTYVEALSKKRAFQHSVGKQSPHKVTVVGNPIMVNGVLRESSDRISDYSTSESSSATPKSSQKESKDCYHLKIKGTWYSTPKLETVQRKTTKTTKTAPHASNLKPTCKTADKSVQTKAVLRIKTQPEQILANVKNLSTRLNASNK